MQKKIFNNVNNYVDKIKEKQKLCIKMGKKRIKNEIIKTTNLITFNQQVVLASSSKTRQEEISKYFKKVVYFKHKINEDQEKKKNADLNAKDLAFHLARSKAISGGIKYKNKLVIGCDQTLECNKKIFSKPNSLIKAKKNLEELSGKKHKLFTCIYVLKNFREYFVEETFAELFFNKVTSLEINNYVERNKETALSCVGSYRIEENEKYNFLNVLKGNKESIIGFPLEKLLRKIRKEK